MTNDIGQCVFPSKSTRWWRVNRHPAVNTVWLAIRANFVYILPHAATGRQTLLTFLIYTYEIDNYTPYIVYIVHFVYRVL